jgi:tripartite-type tricarboxylate transporter receptor subunit TctC
MPQRRQFILQAGSLGAAIAMQKPAAAQASTDKARLLFNLPAQSVMGRFAREVSKLIGPHYTPPLSAESQTAGGPQRFVDTIRRAPPDGSLLMHTQNSLLTLTPHFAANKDRFDPLTDLTPLAALADFTWVLVVAPHVDAKVNTVKDYLAWVSENPEGRNYGVTQFGSIPHLMGTLLSRSVGANIRAVSYASSDAIRRDLGAQALAAGIMPVDSLRGTDDLRLRPLAVVGTQRWPTIPDVPTFAESGFQDLNVTGWYIWAAPPDFDTSVRVRLIDGLRSALNGVDFSGVPTLSNVVNNLVTGQALIDRLRHESRYFDALTKEMRFRSPT